MKRFINHVPKAVITSGLVIVLAAAILLPLLFDLGRFQTADEKRWLANVTGFTHYLSRGQLQHFLQQPHPGITTQWLAAPAVFADSWQIRKLPLVISQAILIGAIAYVASRLWGKTTGVVLALLLAYNPLLVAHIRVYAMDAPLALFSLLSLLLLLLWHKTHSGQYLMFAGAAAAAAALSKLPGVLLIPYSAVLLAGWEYRKPRRLLKTSAIWSAALLVSATLILPSIVLAPAATLGSFAEFFSSADYQELHPAGAGYYLRTLIFFSTPLHLLLIILIPLAWKSLSQLRRRQLMALLLFALLFTLMMSAGAKKGDRYILPVFPALDVLAAVGIFSLAERFMRRFVESSKYTVVSIRNHFLRATYYLLLAAPIIYLAITIWNLHPYTLAYVNPITKPWFGERRHGWGEGLDLAATYLNAKPNAEQLHVASFYPSEFSNYFVGETTGLHNWDQGNVDYAVLYRGQLERGEGAWETDVLNQFAEKEPEHVVSLNGLQYVWIYPLP